MNFKLFLFGVILLTMLIVSSGFFFKYPRNGIYLIPKGYTGDVIILFNQPDGVVPEVENGLYVYKMPENGILKVKIKGYAGIVNKSYYYVDENNERQEIKYLRITGSTDIYGKPKDKFDGAINQDEYENRIFVMNAGGLGSFNTKSGVVQFTTFTVGKPKDSIRLYDKMQERLTEIQLRFLRDH